MSVLPGVAALCAALLVCPAPDVLPPGSRRLTHELVLEASPHFETYELFAAPVRGFGGVTHLVTGEPFRFSTKYGTRIYALDKGAEFPDDARVWVGAPPSAASLAQHGVRAVGAIPVQEQGSAPIGSPVEHVRTHLRVVAVADGEVRLEVVAEHVERDLSGLLALGGALSAGIVGLGLLVRARRRAVAPETPRVNARRG